MRTNKTMSQLSAVLIISLSLYCSTISTAAERDSNSDTTPSFTPVQVKGREKETAVVSNTATASTEGMTYIMYLLLPTYNRG